MLRVKMLPHLSWFETGASGMHTVVKAWWKYLPGYDIELVKPDARRYDLLAVHAGSLDIGPPKDKPVVSHLHGLYWTADYDATKSEYEANRRIVNILRHAREVTVPSTWVAETIQRDLRLAPHVVGHGIDWQEWQHDYEPQGYVLAYAKNRVGDVCDNSFVPDLARRFPKVQFLCTFAPKFSPDNVFTLDGVIPHEQMKRVIQEALVVLSPVKETFGLLTLEAMAAGRPVLGVNRGGNLDLIRHGVNGYLYGDEDMAEGLDYCLKHARVLGENGRQTAQGYTWGDVAGQAASIYREAMEAEPPTVSVVIPVFNKPIEQIKRAIDSCLAQTRQPARVVVVNDGSDNLDKLNGLVLSYPEMPEILILHQSNQGVAMARNNGINRARSTYICCLDADDWLEPSFLETCINALEADPSLGIAYTGLHWHKPDGSTGVSPGNTHWDFDRQLQRANQIWTCNVFRREMWVRLGGYKSRYCPDGAGSEDAELWTRAGAYGWKAEKVTDQPLFNYSWMTGQVTGNPNYQEPDWLAWHPWVTDRHHPLASYATPINQVSHPVRQYDEPIISVIIPVGPGHEKAVMDALDSLEAQRFRRWEAIVVNDAGATAGNHQDWPNLAKAYPYARIVDTPGGKGAGYARNRGVEIARAPLILFLDADDTLRPIDALEKFLDAWNTHQVAIYSDYVGQALVDEATARELQQQGRLESYNPKTSEAIIAYHRSEFDCRRALKQPTTLEDAYNWNVVTTLFPRAWHHEIGGFDEMMETLEDWDYWLRLAKAGHCFRRLPEKLVRYRLRAGQRHIELDTAGGRQNALVVLEYIRSKHNGLEVRDMACGCREDKSGNGATAVQGATSNMNDGDFVKATYTGPRGNHHIMGAFVFRQKPDLPARRRGDGWVLYYGYADAGLETLVHKQDIALMPGRWQVKPEIVKPVEVKRETPAPAAVPIETPLQKLARLKEGAKRQTQARAVLAPEFDLMALSVVTPAIAGRMREAGLDTPAKIKEAGLEGLRKVKGVTTLRAKAIFEELPDD